MANTATNAGALPSIHRRSTAIAHPRPSIISIKPPKSLAVAARTNRRLVACYVALDTDAPSSSSTDDEESEASAKIGRKIRVKAPLRVYHVAKAPKLDLMDMEGEIKQYVGVWKGKKVSANLPFKVEFFVSIEPGRGPLRFFAHLRENEFELLMKD